MHQKIFSQQSPLISMTDYCWLSSTSLEVSQKPGPQVLSTHVVWLDIWPSLTFIFLFSEQVANKENKQEDPVWKLLTLKDWQKLSHCSPCKDIFHDWLHQAAHGIPRGSLWSQEYHSPVLRVIYLFVFSANILWCNKFRMPLLWYMAK